MTHRKRMRHESISKTDAAAIFLIIDGSVEIQSMDGWNLLDRRSNAFLCRRRDDGEEEK